MRLVYVNEERPRPPGGWLPFGGIARDPERERLWTPEDDWRPPEARPRDLSAWHDAELTTHTIALRAEYRNCPWWNWLHARRCSKRLFEVLDEQWRRRAQER